MRMRNRVLTGAAWAVLAALLAACGAAAPTTTTITGSTLSIYTSLPLGGPPAESSVARDVLNAEQLALGQAGGKVGKFTVVLQQPLNDATSAGSSSKLIAANARKVIQRDNAVAYIGEIDPNASAQSIPITNADQLLQVSPYDTAIGLTQPTAAVPGAPNKYYEAFSSYGHTFGRVVPDDSHQAKAQLQVMKSLGVHKVFLVDDGGAYGDAIALAVAQYASTYGITTAGPQPSSAGVAQKIAASGADAVFYGGVASPYSGALSPTVPAYQIFNGAIAADSHLKLFGPGGLDTPSFAAGLSQAAQGVTYLSAPGLSTAELPPAGKAFLTAFKAAYNHPPSPQAIFGYAAMQAVLGALSKAGLAANNRAADVSAFLGAKNISSALGTYSIDKKGDTSLAPYLFSRVKSGSLVAFRALIVP